MQYDMLFQQMGMNIGMGFGAGMGYGMGMGFNLGMGGFPNHPNNNQSMAYGQPVNPQAYADYSSNFEQTRPQVGIDQVDDEIPPAARRNRPTSRRLMDGDLNLLENEQSRNDIS